MFYIPKIVKNLNTNQAELQSMLKKISLNIWKLLKIVMITLFLLYVIKLLLVLNSYCVLYIPPESSKYYNIDLFDQLEEELLEFSAPYNHDNLPIFICGDLNAWCGEINDFVDYNDASIMNLNSEIGNNLSNIVSLESLGIQINRKSLHKKTNNYGHRLIQLCKNNNLYIANSRLKDDAVGNFTCNNASVVDYCLMSPEILSRIMKFSVGPFDPTISDVHNPVHATIAVNHASKDYSYIDIDNKNNNNNIIIPDSKVTRPKLKEDH